MLYVAKSPTGAPFLCDVLLAGFPPPSGKGTRAVSLPRAAAGEIFPGVQLVNRRLYDAGARLHGVGAPIRGAYNTRGEKMVVQVVAECDSHVIFDESVRKRGRETRGSAQMTFRFSNALCCNHLMGELTCLPTLRAVGARALITEAA